METLHAYLRAGLPRPRWAAEPKPGNTHDAHGIYMDALQAVTPAPEVARPEMASDPPRLRRSRAASPSIPAPELRRG